MIPESLTEAIDLETTPSYGYPSEYALQPWRAREGSASITVVAMAHHEGQTLLRPGPGLAEVLDRQRGRPTTTWNGVFDVAWMISCGEYDRVRQIPWYDGMLLWKWLENGIAKERQPAWSLVDAACRFLKDWPLLPDFLDLKRSDPEPGIDDEYWRLRGQVDALVTALICNRIWSKLSPKKRQSATIEAQCIVPVARSWVNGVRMNPERIRQAAPNIAKDLEDLEKSLGVPGKVLGSSQQLGNLLFKQWGIEPIQGFASEKTGVPSTDKKHLTFLADKDDRVLEILRWKELNTRFSKFIKAPEKAFDYLQSTIVHPSPALFSTYTGRMTYRSKIKKKFPTGVALHQWQRNQTVRALIEPPEGYMLVEFDASGQEDRLMAEISGDIMLRKIFQDDMDIHCYTAASITGRGYEELMELKAQDDPWVTGDNGVRQAGKVTNHSNKYRIGHNKMRITARVDYGLIATPIEVKRWQSGFHRSFPGIKRYWNRAKWNARSLGYAETLAGRTFLTPDRFFNKDDVWATESSGINFPIQGSGADMKELAIATMHQLFPEALFAFDLHDGVFFYVPLGTPTELLHEMNRALNSLDYANAWDYQPAVPLLWDGELGPNWGEMTKLKNYRESTLCL